MEHDSFDGVCMLGAMCCATGVGTLRAVGARWMAATVEHVRCLGLEGCQEVPQASQHHRTFSWLHPRTHTRHSVGWGACDTVSFSVTQMPFVIVCVVEERTRKEKPRDFCDARQADRLLSRRRRPGEDADARRRPRAPRPTAHPHAAYKIIAPIRYNEKPITVPYRIRLSVPSDT